MACRILSCDMWGLVPWPGIEPLPPALGALSLSHWTTREVPMFSSFQCRDFLLAEEFPLAFVLEHVCKFLVSLYGNVVMFGDCRILDQLFFYFSTLKICSPTVSGLGSSWIEIYCYLNHFLNWFLSHYFNV